MSAEKPKTNQELALDCAAEIGGAISAVYPHGLSGEAQQISERAVNETIAGIIVKYLNRKDAEKGR